MKPGRRFFSVLIALAVCATSNLGQQQSGQERSFPAISTADESSIAGRAVALDAEGKLLPWPMPDDTGYSYSAYFLSQDRKSVV